MLDKVYKIIDEHIGIQKKIEREAKDRVVKTICESNISTLDRLKQSLSIEIGHERTN